MPVATSAQPSYVRTYNANRGTSAVTISTQIIFGILILTGYLIAPVALIWGWTRFARQPKQLTVSAILSLTGLVFATASAILAVSSVGYAQFHHFPYYDPFASPNISVGRHAFPLGNSVWYRWSVAAWSIALACTRECARNAGILVDGCRR